MPDHGEFSRVGGVLAGRTGEQAVMPDAVEAVGQDVDQEAADELVGGQRMTFCRSAGFDAVILPTEGHGMGIGTDQAWFEMATRCV
jgi:hypothetical protein